MSKEREEVLKGAVDWAGILSRQIKFFQRTGDGAMDIRISFGQLGIHLLKLGFDLQATGFGKLMRRRKKGGTS